MLRLLRLFAFLALAVPGLRAGYVTDKPVRTEAEVRESGRQVVARYSDARLARLGFLDVTKAPYSADPTGKKDATAAIQQALSDARDAQMVTYLPAGRYLVSDMIEGVMGTVKWDHWPYEGFADPIKYGGAVVVWRKTGHGGEILEPLARVRSSVVRKLRDAARAKLLAQQAAGLAELYPLSWAPGLEIEGVGALTGLDREAPAKPPHDDFAGRKSSSRRNDKTQKQRTYENVEERVGARSPVAAVGKRCPGWFHLRHCGGVPRPTLYSIC